ncbi:FAD synthase [Thelohanellus kitauei]|uniref:FAD synthase n=1 Tax=Thelohanellus kitauei TaxID=669202 RepID=A0A0C2MEW5_THEKT|nr:FAD synthase [Thelohanellus kitauei]
MFNYDFFRRLTNKFCVVCISLPDDYFEVACLAGKIGVKSPSHAIKFYKNIPDDETKTLVLFHQNPRDKFTQLPLGVQQFTIVIFWFSNAFLVQFHSEEPSLVNSFLKLYPENSYNLLSPYYDELCFPISPAVSNLDYLDKKIIKARFLIEDILVSYPGKSIFLCFNGGKDSTVMLHLFYAALMVVSEKFEKPVKILGLENIMLLNIRDDPFEELDNFIYQTVAYYGPKLVELDVSVDFRASCFEFSSLYPDKYVCIMGTRLSDGKKLESIQKTDDDWPYFLRIHPLLDFTYEDIWSYIYRYDVPFCQLYNQGYTSLGPKSITKKNENLRIDGTEVYKSACELKDADSERKFR